ncbi:MAG: tetratricopeptide (TPR) repeat protein, partial [Myxococcota bacterium]
MIALAVLLSLGAMLSPPDPLPSIRSGESLIRVADQAKTHHNMGLGLALTGKLDQAAEAFERAIRLDPLFIAPRFALARVQAQLRDRVGALATLTQLHDAGCAVCNGYLARAHNDKAFALLKRDATFKRITGVARSASGPVAVTRAVAEGLGTKRQVDGVRPYLHHTEPVVLHIACPGCPDGKRVKELRGGDVVAWLRTYSKLILKLPRGLVPMKAPSCADGCCQA